MKFSKLTSTSRMNEGYDITAIKEQITSLFRGKLYTPPKVTIEDGTPVCRLSTISRSKFSIVVRVALSDDENEIVVEPEMEYETIKNTYKILDDVNSFIENVLESKEDALIEILRSK